MLAPNEPWERKSDARAVQEENWSNEHNSKPGAEIAAYDSDFFYGNGGWQET